MKYNVADDIAAHNARNAALKGRLLENNVDLNEPRPIDLHFWASDQESAALLGKALYDQGFLLTALAPSQSDESEELWVVDAKTTESPNRVISTSFTEKLVNLAASLQCRYDGWGTLL